MNLLSFKRDEEQVRWVIRLVSNCAVSTWASRVARGRLLPKQQDQELLSIIGWHCTICAGLWCRVLHPDVTLKQTKIQASSTQQDALPAVIIWETAQLCMHVTQSHQLQQAQYVIHCEVWSCCKISGSQMSHVARRVLCLSVLVITTTHVGCPMPTCQGLPSHPLSAQHCSVLYV